MKLNRLKPPVKFKFSHLEFPVPHTYEFNNGIKLHSFNILGSNALKIEFILKNATSFQESQLGINLLLSKLFLSGTSTKNASNLSDLLAQLGAFIDVSPSFDYTSITVHCLKKNVLETIKLISEIFNDINFTNSEIELQKNILSSNYRIQQKKNNIVASQKFRSVLFNNYPYGHTPIPDDWNVITEKNLNDHFKECWNDYEIISIGQNEIYLLNEFENIALTNKSKASTPKVKITEEHIHGHFQIIHVPKSVQCSIKLGCRTISKNHEDYPALLIANYILGGYFGSKLMKNIREDKGLTYGIHSSLINLLQASYFVISSDVEASKKDLAIKEIHTELESLCDVPISKFELDIARNHWIGSFQNDLSSPLALNEKFKSYYLHDLSHDYYNNLILNIQNLDSNDILYVANKYLNPKLMNTLLVGG